MYEVGIPESQHAAMYEANVVGTENVLGAAKEAEVAEDRLRLDLRRLRQHPPPDRRRGVPAPRRATDFTSYYEQTKVEAHRLADRMIEEGLPCTIVQPGGVYGPGDTSQLHDLLDQFLRGKCR